MNSKRRISTLSGILFILSCIILSSVPESAIFQEADALKLSFTFQIELDLDTVDFGSFEFFIGISGLSKLDNTITLPFDRNEVESGIHNQIGEMKIPLINYDLRDIMVDVWRGSLDFIGEKNIDMIGQLLLLYFLGIDDSISNSIEIAKEEIKLYLSGGIGFFFDFDLNSGRNDIEYKLFSFLKIIDDSIGEIALGQTLCNLLDYANTGVSMFAGSKVITLKAIVRSSSGISLGKTPSKSIDFSSYRLHNQEKRVIEGKFSDFSQKSLGHVTVDNQIYDSPNVLFYIMMLIIIIIIAYFLFRKFYLKTMTGRMYLLLFSIPIIIQSYFYPWNLFNDYLFYLISICILVTIIADTFLLRQKRKFKIHKLSKVEEPNYHENELKNKIENNSASIEGERGSESIPQTTSTEGHRQIDQPNYSEFIESENRSKNPPQPISNYGGEKLSKPETFPTKFCLICGTEINKEATYCPNCGNMQWE